MITCMIVLNAQMSVSLHIGYIENIHINNQTILQFVNSWSKKVPNNNSYTRVFKNIHGYSDATISPSYVRYIIIKEKQTKQKNRMIK